MEPRSLARSPRRYCSISAHVSCVLYVTCTDINLSVSPHQQIGECTSIYECIAIGDSAQELKLTFSRNLDGPVSETANIARAKDMMTFVDMPCLYENFESNKEKYMVSCFTSIVFRMSCRFWFLKMIAFSCTCRR